MLALLMDGDPHAAYAISHMLMGAGSMVDHAGSAERGMVLAQQNHYDVVIADLILPDLSGRELVRRIRAVSPTRPLLILSRVNDTNGRTNARDAGADAYIKKPIDRNSLLDGLRSLVGHRAGRAPSPQPPCGSTGLAEPISSARPATFLQPTVRHSYKLPTSSPISRRA